MTRFKVIHIWLVFFIFLNTEGGKNYVLGNITRGNLTIHTKVGDIRGLKATDGNYTMFMGIPYAKVDESNPFGLSSPYPIFDEPFEAYNDSTICPQIEEFNGTTVGTLSCLQLNIYVPDSASVSNPLPVIIWIHGGGFSIGFANRYLFGPSYLVQHDVILVTVNYRLGPYGFMCLDTPEVPGNQGLKDQLLGLKWIKNNIEFFGGDPNHITAFGQSVGSMSVHLHLLSPNEKLFQKVIMHSGSAFTADLIIDVDRSAPIKLAEKLGLTTSDINEALSFLAKTDTNSVIEAASRIDSKFWPCKESEHKNVENFVTDYPINQNIPKIKGMPILIGFNEDELIPVYANMSPESFAGITIFYDYLRDFFTYDHERFQEIHNIVTNFYLGGKTLSQAQIHKITDFTSDFVFNVPTHRCIRSFLKNGADKIYFFKFSYVGDRNFVRRKNNITIGGAAHTDELAFLFDMEFIPEIPSPEDQLTIDRMTTMWTNFAKYGDPTPETSSLLPVKWKPITAIHTPENFLNIDLEMNLETNPFNKRMSFWDLMYYSLEEYQIGFKRSHATLSTSFYGLYFNLCLIMIIKFVE